MIYCVCAGLYGVLISIQSAFSTTISATYGTWFSTVVVHLSGFIALTPIALTKWGRPTQRSPWYLHLGGLIGVANVACSNYSMVRIGMTNSNMLMLLAMIVFSTIMDSLGLIGSRKRRITPLKLVAIGVMLLGVASIAVLSRQAAVLTLGAAAASMLRGVGLVVSRQLNGQLTIRSGKGYSTYMNYVTGLTGAILVFFLLGSPMQAAFPAPTVPVWCYLCGAIGCFGIIMCNTAAPKLSALTMSLVPFVCETTVAILFDLFRGHLSVATIVGCAITSVGMVLNIMAERAVPADSSCTAGK